MTNYLQKLWGDSLENVSIEDVKLAIKEIQQMDDEHGAFWVGLTTNIEDVLEVWKDLTVTGIFNDDLENQLRFKANNWSEVENLYKMFLSEDLSGVKNFFSLK